MICGTLYIIRFFIVMCPTLGPRTLNTWNREKLARGLPNERESRRLIGRCIFPIEMKKKRKDGVFFSYFTPEPLDLYDLDFLSFFLHLAFHLSPSYRTSTCRLPSVSIEYRGMIWSKHEKWMFSCFPAARFSFRLRYY